MKAKIFLMVFVGIMLVSITPTSAEAARFFFSSHVEKTGWQEPKLVEGRNTIEIGTTNKGLQMEAIFANGPVTMYAHVGGMGWVQASTDNFINVGGNIWQGSVCGTVGQGRPIEAVYIKSNDPYTNIRYQAHVKDKGWLPWVNETAFNPNNTNTFAGTTGESRQMEALRIQLY